MNGPLAGAIVGVLLVLLFIIFRTPPVPPIWDGPPMASTARDLNIDAVQRLGLCEKYRAGTHAPRDEAYRRFLDEACDPEGVWRLINTPTGPEYMWVLPSPPETSPR